MKKSIFLSGVKIRFWTLLFLHTSLTVFSQDNQRIVIDGKAFDRSQIHVYPNSIPKFTIAFPDSTQEIRGLESIGTLKNENFIVTTWLQSDTDGLHYALIHHKIPPTIESELKNRPKRSKAFLKRIATGALSAFGAIKVKIERHDYKTFLGFETVCRSNFSELLLVKSRIYKVHNDLFYIVAADKELDVNSIDQFMNSFKLD